MNNKNTVVYIRIKSKRPDNFQNTTKFEWNEDKEHQLWSFISSLDDSMDHVDWETLSTGLNTPIFFLKRRSFKLFKRHLLLLEKEVEDKKRMLQEKDRKSSISRMPQVSLHPISLDNQRNNPEFTNNIIRSFRSEGSPDDDTTKSIQLECSKLHKTFIKEDNKDNQDDKGDAIGNEAQKDTNISNSDISSSLSISKSALEDALMERLHF